MWIPLALAAAGALLATGGLFVVVDKIDCNLFTDKVEPVERLGVYAVVAGIGLIIVANILTYCTKGN